MTIFDYHNEFKVKKIYNFPIITMQNQSQGSYFAVLCGK